MKAAPVAAANMRLRKIERSSMGAATRPSITTNSGSSTAAAARLTITTSLSHPDSPPFDTPSTSPVRPSTNVSVPSGSRPRSSSRLASSPSTSPPHRLPASASGTLNQNTHCQPISTSAPPSTGPSTRPTAATIVLVPIASPSCSRGNASVTSAAAFANRNAAPTPCTIRHRISCVPSAEKPAPSDAAANTAKPAT